MFSEVETSDLKVLDLRSTYGVCFLYEYIKLMDDGNSSRMWCSDKVSLQCESSHVISDVLTDRISCRRMNTQMVSYGFKKYITRAPAHNK